jgi:hypothetical protein
MFYETPFNCPLRIGFRATLIDGRASSRRATVGY